MAAVRKDVQLQAIIDAEELTKELREEIEKMHDEVATAKENMERMQKEIENLRSELAREREKCTTCGKDHPKSSDWFTLWNAVSHNDLLSVRTLICQGRAGLEEAQKDTTPLQLAAKLGYAEIAEELLRAGASTRLHKEYAGLHLACLNKHLPVVQLLMAHGADINERNDNGWTPLIFAVITGAIDVVRCLLEAGADSRLTSKVGRTALDLARDPDYFVSPAIVALLEEPRRRH